MSNLRTIARLHPALREDIGDLVTRRPLPPERSDVFLFLAHHGPQVYAPGSRGLPFGPHPHRGFETVTFIVDGELCHRDNGGHESIIGAGGVQWMTAGRGIIHEEVSPDDFKRRGGPMQILQLWVNLPARLKMTEPHYVGLQGRDIPAVAAGDATLNLISGKFAGRTGPVTSRTGVFMSTVAVKSGGRTKFDGLSGRDVFLYVVEGAITIGGLKAPAWNLVELSDGDLLEVEATQDCLLLFGHAQPIREPVVAYGPFVMNSEDEIRQAYADYRAGRFGAVSA
jgi:redox-sensitive bicupin YhaK (pirin superfamily)